MAGIFCYMYRIYGILRNDILHEVTRLGKKKVIVAMSGGVDSSLTAALLRDKGYEVIGITLRLADENRDSACGVPDRGCCSEVSVDDARRVAEILGIPHYVLEFRELFREKVIANFLAEYARGRTPNPCIACNRYIKFAAMLAKADEIGADYVATGHYARITQEPDGEYALRKGIDAGKDQSYVLYNLTQAMLRRFLFPLGDYKKEHTRELAAAYELPVANKPDSQEICFVPNDDYKAYIRQHNPGCLIPGDIVDLAGHVLGHHDGVPLYTIGQRRGLGIAAPEPLYVVGLDTQTNRVIVGGAQDVFAQSLTATDLNWLSGRPIPERIKCRAKTRYGKREGEAVVERQPDGSVRVRFEEPQRAITPGQSVVFYDGDRVLGGGIIDSVLRN